MHSARGLVAVCAAILATGCPGMRPQPAGQAGETEPQIPLSEAARPGGALPVPAGEGLGYPRFADYHSGVVVFSAEGDLWQVPVSGGLARRLTTHPGTEFFAHFSPDGKRLAFSGDYDGNQDVFVMPAVGGVPHRLTYHPSEDQVLGWTPDSRSVLFRSRRDHPHGDWTLYTVPLESGEGRRGAPMGGDAVRLPLSRAARLSFEPGGARVAINVTDNDFHRWKRYAGGRSAQIFVGDLKGGPFVKRTTFLGANAFPMWHGGRIYFLSDRTGTANIWSMTPEGRDLKQHTHHRDYDVRFPSLGQGKIVYSHRAGLRLLDLQSGHEQPIPVRVVSDGPLARARFVQPTRFLTDFELSPDGNHLALEIRGDLHLIPAGKEGRRLRLTQSSSSRERGLSFSDDGKRLASTSDASGECEVTIVDATGATPPRQVTRGGKRYKYPPRWSPGGKWIAYADSDGRLFKVPAAGGTPTEIDRSPYGHIRSYRWSPDGAWLAYARIEENYFASIYLYEVEKGRKLRVTDGYTKDWSPHFSADGKYLVFMSERTINPYLDRLDEETIVDRATKPYLVLLSSKTRSPFLPRDPAEEEQQAKAAKEAKAQKKKAGAGAPPPRVEVEADGIADRVLEVPVAAGNLGGLFSGDGFLFYLSQPTLGMAEWEHSVFEGKERVAELWRFDFKKKKAEKFADGVVDYSVARDGSRMVLRKPEAKFYAFKLEAKAPGDKEWKELELPLAALRHPVEVRQEWRQMFGEAWRMMRDFYFDPDMGKVDWPAVRSRYEALLPHVGSREELEDLLGEMVSELSLGHTYLWGGDTRQPERVPVGLLGADLEPHPSGHYRFARILDGVSWDPRRVSPLTEPHARVKAGEFLQKIDGREVRCGEDVYSHLQKAAGEQVQLTVSADPEARKARQVEITTLRSEQPIRYFDWVKHNRERVGQKTEAKIGYLHLPDMMTAGMVEFDRWYYPQVFKQGLIVDARWNRGGFVSQMIVKRLARRALSWAKSRSGYIAPYPENTLNGPVVVLTNERAGSDGDIFPRAVQVGRLGPVIGTRTWGGVVGISLNLPADALVDFGVSTRPGYFAWWEPERRWGVEGEGVTPDVIVENDPGAEFRGTDAQLEKGIALAMELLKKAPPRAPQFGEYPDKRAETWVKRYGKTDAP
jgi:tricorn protease